MQPQADPLKAVIYTRVSSKLQATNGQGAESQ